MGQVGVTINGQNYQIACDDGQESHLKDLAKQVDSRVGELVSAVGQVGDMRLLVMASLLLADEVNDTKGDLERIHTDEVKAGEQATLNDAVLATGIEALAERIETLAERLEES